MPPLKNILVIAGPTASGKSALAMRVAALLPSEIISADSRQLYTYLTIGTAKPTPQELHSVPHHCIDIRTPDQPFNAGDFQTVGRDAIEACHSRGRLPIVVGGTGLYIRAVVDGFFEQPEMSGRYRAELEHRLADEGKEALFAELQKVDPVSAATMDASKQRRVIRALEVFMETGVPISQHHQQHVVQPLYHARFFGILWERPVLYARIEERVDRMLASGFLDEVKRLMAMGFDDRFQALQTVGYKEALAFLRGEITEERMIELMKQNTRRFAKRQMTWFRKEARISWLPTADDIDLDAHASHIAGLLR
ncbi:MAG: tRNA (adenosine(37)-N6)-dimethylallyltransferase MiaA [Bacteroidetes bacterium]|nr:tRNA (adenosine(37)-N6)-dimethylallyltransferase MiaA [Bacteroidota bacterium]